MEEDLRLQKKKMRKHILNLRDALTKEEQEAAKRQITERILAHPWYIQAKMLLGFASYGSEICTDAILQDALRQGKQLFLPKILGDEMQFFQVEDMAGLEIGFKGIREPSGREKIFAYDEYAAFGEREGQADGMGQEDMRVLMLMPGTAFDSSRRRIGYGKGFYDRFLADMPALMPYTIGICHRCQMVEEVPCGELDLRPAQVIHV